MEFLDYASQIVGLIAGIISFCPTQLRKTALRFATARLPSFNHFLGRVVLTSILIFIPVPDAGSITVSMGVGAKIVVLA